MNFAGEGIRKLALWWKENKTDHFYEKKDALSSCWYPLKKQSPAFCYIIQFLSIAMFTLLFSMVHLLCDKLQKFFMPWKQEIQILENYCV